MRDAILQSVGGMVAVVVGLIFLQTVLDSAETAGGAVNIGSFSGVRNINDTVPLIFVVGVLVLGIGLLISGGLSAKRQLSD